MIKQLASKNCNAGQVKNNVGMTPLHMYLGKKHILTHIDHQNVYQDDEDLSTVSPIPAIALLKDGAECDIHQMIRMGLEYEVMGVVLALNGISIEVELGRRNEVTGLYPFMSGAMLQKCRLADIYMMGMANVNNLK